MKLEYAARNAKKLTLLRQGSGGQGVEGLSSVSTARGYGEGATKPNQTEPNDTKNQIVVVGVGWRGAVF